MLRRSVEPGAVSRMVSVNASAASPFTALRFWFMSLPYQSWTVGADCQGVGAGGGLRGERDR